MNHGDVEDRGVAAALPDANDDGAAVLEKTTTAANIGSSPSSSDDGLLCNTTFSSSSLATGGADLEDTSSSRNKRAKWTLLATLLALVVAGAIAGALIGTNKNRTATDSTTTSSTTTSLADDGSPSGNGASSSNAAPEDASFPSPAEPSVSTIDGDSPAANPTDASAGSTAPVAGPSSSTSEFTSSTTPTGLDLYRCGFSSTNDDDAHSTPLPSAGGRIALGKSIQGSVCLLVSSDGTITFGRSYEGRHWELAAPSSRYDIKIKFTDCFDEYCEVDLPEAETAGDVRGFQLISLSHSVTTEQEMSRFLAQTTFGPKRSEIDSLAASASSTSSPPFREWIRQQIYDIPATLHREYFRKRANQRQYKVTATARPRRPCESDSRWHRFAFTTEDQDKTVLVAPSNSEEGGYLLLIDGLLYTEVEELTWETDDKSEFIICHVDERLVEMNVTTEATIVAGGTCESNSTKVANPLIVFSTVDPPLDRILTLSGTGEPFALVELNPPLIDVRLLQVPSTSTCSGPASAAGGGAGDIVFLKDTDGSYYKHDARMVLLENTLDSPVVGNNSRLCANPDATFLNQDSCIVVSGNEACAPADYRSKLFVLEEETIRMFFTLSGRYVYSIDGLRLGDGATPCGMERSRWKRHLDCGDEVSNAKLEEGTLQTLTSLLRGSDDGNAYVRDIIVPNDAACDTSSIESGPIKLSIEESDGTISCFEFVHPNLLDVYDFTEWGEPGGHPGNSQAAKKNLPNPIKKLAAIDQSTVLQFPSWHPMSRWNVGDHSYLGRLGDEVDFIDLPSEVQSKTLASQLGALYDEVDSPGIHHSLLCGSPGEVANDPRLGARLPFETDGFDLVRNLTDSEFFSGTGGDKSAWIMSSLYADDQLRQRVAFAISEIIVVGAVSARASTDETRTAFYDIFVRHAFGNYRDVLKEVSFNPLMGDYLSFVGSTSFAFNGRFPDENYAREIMQLFTIGLVRLNNDGTILSDETSGEPIPTYDNDDISEYRMDPNTLKLFMLLVVLLTSAFLYTVSFSRIWTGFQRRSMRANIDGWMNRIDTLAVSGSRHDVFPKTDLSGGYIGDRYPLCTDLPPQDFLRSGATYEFIGTSGEASLALDEENSELYDKLCASSSVETPCNYSPTVILDENLRCYGVECDLEFINVVKVGGASYKYIPRRCVSLQFFNEGRTTAVYGWREICLDPREAAAGELCCTDGTWQVPKKYCQYPFERLSFYTAKSRCEENGMVLCQKVAKSIDCPTSCCPSGEERTWRNTACTVKVQIDSNGHVAAVHDVNKPFSYAAASSGNWFKVRWLVNRDEIPSVARNQCDGGACTISGNTCICDVEVEDSPVFESMPASRDEILSGLNVGSFSPESGYIEDVSNVDGVRVFHRENSSPFNADTVFEVKDEYGHVIHLRNLRSMVNVGTSAFRNPPSFLRTLDPRNDRLSLRRSLFEIDALLDHLVTHPNIAPFMAYRLIQRLVTSNPSPRYVEVVANAFKSGEYDGFGSGKNGDLAATVAAILLDPEARSVALDADPTYGHLREPLLKLMGALRSLEYKPFDPEYQLELHGKLQSRIGQMIHEAPSVFSFFRPDFSPPGTRVDMAGLVAPEAQVITTSSSVMFLNTMRALAKFGLTARQNGPGRWWRSVAANMTIQPSQAVEELDLLLVNGRLSKETRSILAAEYESMLNAENEHVALRHVLQLLIAAPEFHISNAHKNFPSILPSENRSSTAPLQSASDEGGGTLQSPKTIVYLNLNGGADSFNMLVPHSGCGMDGDLYSQYSAIRSSVAIDKEELLLIDAPNGPTCKKFGLHPKLKTMQRLYQDGDLLWVSNAGSLVEPVSRDTLESKQLPNNNFAHNIMARNLETVHTNSGNAVGVLGRIADALAGKGFSTGAFSMRPESKIQENVPGKSPSVNTVDPENIEVVTPWLMVNGDTKDAIMQNLTSPRSSVFGDTWSATLRRGISRSAQLRAIVDKNPTKASADKYWKTGTGLENSLKQVAKLLAGREELGTDRNTFSVAIGGFDAHKSLQASLNVPLVDVDTSLESFVAELKEQGIWNEVVVVVASEFGRALVSNGLGTDHGWGG